MVEAFPLCWPVGYKRTLNSQKKHAPFKTSFANARDGVIRELKLMGATGIIISSNVPLKRDGLPYAVPFGNSKSITDDTGIAVYFTFNNEQKVLCCDAFICLDDNMQAINKTVEALRGIDRWGCSDILNQTFTGFKALSDTTMRESEVWQILGLHIKPAGIETLHAAYRSMAKKLHPDAGGTAEAFHRLQQAYEQAKNLFK
jgi:hypothetical protein